MLEFSEIIISFLSVLVLLFTAIFSGFLLQALVSGIFKNLPGKLDVFWKLLSGTLLLISLYAIWSTRGMTIFLMTPVLLFFFVKQKMMVADAKPFSKQSLIFFTCLILFNFAFYLFAINSFDPEYVKYVSGDFGIYYRMAQQLNESGIETLSLDPVYVAKHASPYHYGDIWMYGIVSRFVSVNPSVVFLVAFTHFSIIFISGIYTFAWQRFEKYIGGKSAYLYLLLFAGLFTGFNIFFPRFIIPSAEPYTLSVMNWSKVLVPSSFLISLLILAKNRNWWAFVLLAMIAGLSFINALPAVFMAVFLMLTVNALRGNINWKQWFGFHLCYVLITVVFVVFLYKVLPALSGNAPTAPDTVRKAIDIKQYLSTGIKIFIGGWFQLFVLTPFMLIFLAGIVLNGQLKQLFYKIKTLDNDLLFLVFMVFSGLVCWALLHPFAVDAVQFYTNVLAPVYAIAISFLAMYVLYVFRNKILSLIMIFCLAACIFVHRADVFFVNKHDRSEWTAITTYLNRQKSKDHSFASFRPMNHFGSYFDKNTIYFMPLGYLSYHWPDYHNFSLNAPFIPVNESSLYADEERKEIDLAPFSTYYNQEIKNGQKPAEEIMGKFIAEQHIGYLSVSRDTMLPPYFRNLVIDSLVLEKANFIIYRIK